MRVEIFPNVHKILKVSKADDPQILAQQFTIDHNLDHSSIKFLTQKIVQQTRVLNGKIFLEQTLASFLERNFGFQFAEPGGIWRIRRIIAEICRICQIRQATLRIKLNCNFWKFAIRASLKNDIRC